MGTKNNPGEHDCYANAAPDEPLFVLLGRDKYAASLVHLWAIAKGTECGTTPKIEEALACSDAMFNWCNNTGKESVYILNLLPAELLQAELARRGAKAPSITATLALGIKTDKVSKIFSALSAAHMALSSSDTVDQVKNNADALRLITECINDIPASIESSIEQ